MHKIAQLPEAKRTELFRETAAQKGMTPAIAEKDFWVTFVLERIFSDEKLSSILIFKGGTSLSKVYGVIERFSEDIDLILDWNLLKKAGHWNALSFLSMSLLSKKDFTPEVGQTMMPQNPVH